MRAAWSLLVVLGAGCFSGEGTIGAICTEDADCGADQGCEHEVCGRCADGVAQAGELCFGDPDALVAASVASRSLPLPLDGDERSDLVVFAPGSTDVFAFLADGLGLVATATLTFVQPLVAADHGDLDGDGATDLAVVSGEEIVVAFGDGAGGLTVGLTQPAGAGARSLAVVAAAAQVPGRLVVTTDAGSLMWWTVDAARVASEVTVVPVEGTRPTLGRAAILTRDGAPDLVVGTADGSVTVWPSTADGFSRGSPVSAGGPVDALTVLDVDGDGGMDVVTLGLDGRLGLLFGDGTGQLFPSEVLTVPGPALAVTAADVTRDTRRDVLVATEGSGVVVFVARGREYPDFAGLDLGVVASDVWLTDLDGDQRGDLVLSTTDGLVVSEANP
jgi:hypothetical protein